ncbi:MAG: DUF1653 domain-containing protein [Clostridia bacterium]|nr:DUF1653 domain-containing protein [Clostridia bacterium]
MVRDIEKGVYRHYKGGFVYVICTASHSDRDELLIVYQGLNNGKFYARPIESFADNILGVKGEVVEPRFRKATNEEIQAFVDSGECSLDAECLGLED